MKNLARLFPLLLSLMLTACGREEYTPSLAESTPSLMESTKQYTAEKRYVQLEDSGPIRVWTETPEQLLYVATNAENNVAQNKLFAIDKAALEDKDLEREFSGVPITFEADTYPQVIYSDGTGLVTILTGNNSDSNYAFYLQNYQLDGTLTNTLDISNTIKDIFRSDESVIFTKAAVDSHQNHYFLYRSTRKKGLLILDSEGNLQHNHIGENNTFLDLNRAGDNIYILFQYENTNNREYICQVDTSSFQLKQLVEIPNGRGSTSMSALSEDVLWFSDYEHLWKYQITTNTLTSILAWTDAGITGREVADLAVDAKEHIAVILREQSMPSRQKLLYLREPALEQTNTEKIVITIEGSGSNTLLRKTIGQFNASNDKYEAELVHYDTEKLLVELISGKGPDLIAVNANGGLGPEFLAERGVIEDLSPYLDNSANLLRSDILEVILKLYTINDVLTAIPPAFTVYAPMGRASELGTEPGWTFRDFLEYVDVHKGATIYGGASRGDSNGYLIAHYLYTNWSNLVDYTNKEAHFDTVEFRQILEYAKGYEDIYGQVSGTDDDFKDRLQEGKLLLYDQSIRRPSSLKDYKQLFSQDMVVIGYPSADGKASYGISTSCSYGINAKSAHKEGAWEFIEFMLTLQDEEVKNAKSDWNFSFSSYLPALDYQFESALEQAAYHKGEAVSAEIYEANKQNIEETRNIINNASFLFGQSGPVADIVNEEFFAYLENGPEYTVDMTVNNIQNRVQLYLDTLD